MDETLRLYLADLVSMWRQELCEAREAARGNGHDSVFEAGRAMAYAEVLIRMQNQADAFQVPKEAIGLEGFDPAVDLAKDGP